MWGKGRKRKLGGGKRKEIYCRGDDEGERDRILCEGQMRDARPRSAIAREEFKRAKPPCR